MCLTQTYTVLLPDKHDVQAEHLFKLFIWMTQANKQLLYTWCIHWTGSRKLSCGRFLYWMAAVYVRSWNDEFCFSGREAGYSSGAPVRLLLAGKMCVWRRGAAKERDTHTHTMKGRRGYNKRLCNLLWENREMDDVLLSHAFMEICGELREEKIQR